MSGFTAAPRLTVAGSAALVLGREPEPVASVPEAQRRTRTQDSILLLPDHVGQQQDGLK
jgi:hypothetical protein